MNRNQIKRRQKLNARRALLTKRITPEEFGECLFGDMKIEGAELVRFKGFDRYGFRQVFRRVRTIMPIGAAHG